jgi:uncharacterized membrane protein HdeD (DUF308 family)
MPASWRSVLLEGIALTAVGVLLLTTDRTAYVLLVSVGIWWLIGGVLTLVRLFNDRNHRARKLVTAILEILGGLAIMAFPTYAVVFATTALTRIVGVLAIIPGGAAVARAVLGEGWAAGILGVVGVVLGLLLVSIGTGFAIAAGLMMVGVCAITGGISAIIYALRLARRSST